MLAWDQNENIVLRKTADDAKTASSSEITKLQVELASLRKDLQTSEVKKQYSLRFDSSLAARIPA